MSKKDTPDPDRRSLLELLLRDPERLGRELGRAYREVMDALNPPAVSPEEYQQALERIEMLEAQAEELEEQRAQDQELIRQLILQVVSQDKKLTEILALLQASESPQDREQIPRWRQLRERLWKILTTLAGGTALAGALRDAWVQEEVWPVVETLPQKARNAWMEFFDSGRAEDRPPEVPEPTPEPTSVPATSLEPELIRIPAGRFRMGSDPRQDQQAYGDEQPQHTLYLPTYHIAKTPVTNAQYAAFVRNTGHDPPRHWKNGRVPRGKHDHPVRYVAWHDAVAYCRWLSRVTDKDYHLPSEAEWEKAARGTDGRIYPWGNDAPNKDLLNFNNEVGGTTAVGRYPDGASPYGVLDMAGNVWEWTRSLWGKDWPEPDFEYPYDPGDGREDLEAGGLRVLRGGAFSNNQRYVRCAGRYWYGPDARYGDGGFRVVVSPFTSDL